MSSKPGLAAIGIDLGTTFSVAAVYHNNKTEVIPDRNGKRTIPSCVFYSPNSATILVGKDAEKEGAKYPQNLLFDMKRIIGRKYSDAYVQQFINSKEYQFKIVEGADNRAEIELEHNKQTIRKTPEEVCSEIIKYLREAATDFLGKKVTKAVISVPAYFSMAQKKATKKAAEIAKLTVERLITEPVAAAVCYAQERLDHPATLLVFDFGGGTLDISIIKVDERKFKVKSVRGDTFLGGRDFDKKILAEVEKELIQEYGNDNKLVEKINKKMLKIKNACIDLKEDLSNKYKASTESIDIIGEMEYEKAMSRTDFEVVAAPLFERVRKTIEKCINDAQMEKNDITDVILVGGSSRIPKVQEILKQYFKTIELKSSNLDEAVALGAAMQASGNQDFEKYKVTEVTPLSLGLRLEGDLMAIAIQKNSSLPAKSEPIKLCTIKNNQTNGEFKIYEGERKQCKYNNLLGSFTLNDLPTRKAGEVQLETIFSLDEDGILEIEAYEVSTEHKRQKLSLTLGEYRLCDYQIDECLDDAKKNEQEDELFKNRVQTKMKINLICNQIIYELNKIPLDDNRTFVEIKCREMKRVLKDFENLEVAEMTEKYEEFKRHIKNLIDSYITIKDETILPTINQSQHEISEEIVKNEHLSKNRPDRKKR